MEPKAPGVACQRDLFCARLDRLLNPTHGLFQPARSRNWTSFENEIGLLCVQRAMRPVLSTALFAVLNLLDGLVVGACGPTTATRKGGGSSGL